MGIVNGLLPIGTCHGCSEKIRQVTHSQTGVSSAVTDENVVCRQTMVTKDGQRLWLCQRCEDMCFVMLLDSIHAEGVEDGG